MADCSRLVMLWGRLLEDRSYRREKRFRRTGWLNYVCDFP